jgi:hypothetical protein
MEQFEDEKKNYHSYTVTGVNEECINNKKFREELMVYFPFAVICVKYDKQKENFSMYVQ